MLCYEGKSLSSIQSAYNSKLYKGKKMDRLIKRLKELSAQFPLEENFDWEFPISPIEIPENIIDTYSKNIYLKENFYQALQHDLSLENHYWIIQEWGGIKSLKQNNRNDEKIKKFKKQLATEKLTKEIFSLISSFSKLASFIDSNEYAIYDSRAIYSLNWLLFNFTNEKELYPQPSGRNPKLSQYDLPTIIKLSKQGHTNKSHKTAYQDYCKLLKYLSRQVFNDDKPYKIEMLLFIIAPTIIIDCIERKTKIMIEI